MLRQISLGTDVQSWDPDAILARQSRVPHLVWATFALCLVVTALWMIPRPDYGRDVPVADAAEPAPRMAAVPETDETVTRSEVAITNVVQVVHSPAETRVRAVPLERPKPRTGATLVGKSALPNDTPASAILRPPLRLSQAQMMRPDFQVLIAKAMDAIAPGAPVDQALQRMIAGALEAGQSNQFVDALLNTAHAKGEITVPPALMTGAGAINTELLLSAMVTVAGI